MDKKSGVYYQLTDNSLRVGGSSQFGGIMPMYTIKGELGKLIRVTARDYKDKLGFDLNYNPNYLGLDKILSSVAFLEVLRCNLEPTVAYKIWENDGTPRAALGFGSADAVGFSAPDETVWVSCNSPGSWGDDLYVCFALEEGILGDISAVYTLYVYSVEKGVSSLINSYSFSLSEESDIYYKNIGFGDLVFGYKGDFPINPTFFADVSSALPQDDKFRLHPGDNGDKVSSSLDITELFPSIDKSSANVVVMNGFIEAPMTSKGIINAIVTYCAKQDRSVLLDAPILTDSNTGTLRALEDLFEWSRSLLSTDGHYAQVAAVPDLVNIGTRIEKIMPSVYLFLIYANMFDKQGSINFPPAGNTYGAVTVNELMESDFYLYGDELKTNRINYLTETSKGVCMWEYRTLYNQGASDLSYANTPYILRDLKGRLLSFMENFSFRYATPVDLLTIRSGLDSILGSFVRNFFLVNYTLHVPTFEEAQAAGRELDIDISVAVINSADVITLRVTLENAANLRA